MKRESDRLTRARVYQVLRVYMFVFVCVCQVLHACVIAFVVCVCVCVRTYVFHTQESDRALSPHSFSLDMSMNNYTLEYRRAR